MGSENKMNDATSFQQSDKPILCANGCGFFGAAATMNLCSKCYRDLRLKEEQAVSAKAAVEKSMSSSVSPVALVVEQKAFTAAPGPSMAAEVAPQAPAKPANRCMSCNKKVGLTGFKCKCGSTFCGSHRYPGRGHDCNFDYKGAGRDAIAKANPIVKADKIQRF
uniref:AN1-type domain-containing protein n=1 Tax=Opuntia streptacantha TaxID=393608 RepID=A0A7C8YY98_OPUST